jgi:hypothetical protein
LGRLRIVANPISMRLPTRLRESMAWAAFGPPG